MTPFEKKLEALIKRRHPDYAEKLEHWEYCSATYKGGRKWYEDNIFTHSKESACDFNNRLKRSYRFNHTREVVNLINKYIFKAEFNRSKDAPAHIKDFWASATKEGYGIDKLMSKVDIATSVLGSPWVIVDSTNIGGAVVTKADEAVFKARTYAYVVEPQNVLDFSYSDDGVLQWILLAEPTRDDTDPLGDDAMLERYRLWTREYYLLLEVERDADDKSVKNIKEVDYSLNEIGTVPAVPVRAIDADTPYSSPALVDDIAYLDRAVANYLSNLDEIIQDQTFSQLAIPAQALVAGDEEESRSHATEMGTKRIFSYNADVGKGPEYIAPDASQAGVISGQITKIISEIYHSVGMSGERTKTDNGMGIDNSSGVAKAYDFDRMNALLVNKADLIERVETEILNLVNLYHGKTEMPFDELNGLVSYPTDFDTRGLGDEFSVAEKLMKISAPKTLRREHIKTLAAKLYPNMSKGVLKELEEELLEWLEMSEMEEAELALKQNPDVMAKKSTADNRQGQVTDKTEKPGDSNK